MKPFFCYLALGLILCVNLLAEEMGATCRTLRGFNGGVSLSKTLSGFYPSAPSPASRPNLLLGGFANRGSCTQAGGAAVWTMYSCGEQYDGEDSKNTKISAWNATSCALASNQTWCEQTAHGTYRDVVPLPYNSQQIPAGNFAAGVGCGGNGGPGTTFGPQYHWKCCVRGSCTIPHSPCPTSFH